MAHNLYLSTVIQGRIVCVCKAFKVINVLPNWSDYHYKSRVRGLHGGYHRTVCNSRNKLQIVIFIWLMCKSSAK